MKLLVFAHTPPPLHGQSAMVRLMVEGLRGDPELELFHVNPRLSRDAGDIGRWRPGKLLSLLRACGQAWRLRASHGPMVLYYVPAPGKRGALWRDWIVMLLCRPFFSGLVLHWHAVGLGRWLTVRATPPERWLSRIFLGRAALAIVLAPQLADDVRGLSPRRVTVVPNGIPDPGTPDRIPPTTAPREVLFLGLCSREKGAFVTLAAAAILEARHPGFARFVFAGAFANPREGTEFLAQAAPLAPGLVNYVGPVGESHKRALLSAAGVFCFPTRYPHEGQPLTLIEAMAYDVPIVTTPWRAIPAMLPGRGVRFIGPDDAEKLADALFAALQDRSADGELRRHFLAHFTCERHLAALRAALLSAR